MESMLHKILEAKRRAVEKARQTTPLTAVMNLAAEAPPARDFKAALLAEGLSIIAEIKRASPSRGVIAGQVNIASLAEQYQEGGARAVSVLTEESSFAGRPEDLREVKDAVTLPVLRKDFIFDQYQVWESRVLGADGVLLLASVLDLIRLRNLIRLARKLQLTPLVEVHNLPELHKSMDAGADVIGVNARSLSTFVVDLEVPLSLASVMPPGITKIAESGIKTREDISRLEEAGYDAALIGETLMKADHPARKLQELTSGGA